jgi:hypothetical protein
MAAWRIVRNVGGSRIYATQRLTRGRVNISVAKTDTRPGQLLPFVEFKYGLPKTIGLIKQIVFPIRYGKPGL